MSDGGRREQLRPFKNRDESIFLHNSYFVVALLHEYISLFFTVSYRFDIEFRKLLFANELPFFVQQSPLLLYFHHTFMFTGKSSRIQVG